MIAKFVALGPFAIFFATGCATSHSHDHAAMDAKEPAAETATSGSIYVCPPGCVHPCASEKVARLPECDCK